MVVGERQDGTVDSHAAQSHELISANYPQPKTPVEPVHRDRRAGLGKRAALRVSPILILKHVHLPLRAHKPLHRIIELSIRFGA